MRFEVDFNGDRSTVCDTLKEALEVIREWGAQMDSEFGDDEITLRQYQDDEE